MYGLALRYSISILILCHDLKVSSQVCTVNNTLFANVGRGKWGVVWGWKGDGLLVCQLDSASIGPKWSPS